MRKLIEPLLYILGFTLAVKLILKLKYAPMILLGIVANDISINDRLYLIGLMFLWIVLAFIAVITIKNATKIGIKFMDKIRKENK